MHQWQNTQIQFALNNFLNAIYFVDVAKHFKIVLKVDNFVQTLIAWTLEGEGTYMCTHCHAKVSWKGRVPGQWTSVDD